MTFRRPTTLINLDQDILRRARTVGALTIGLRSALPPGIGPFCWVAGHAESTLDVVVESAALATDLRYTQREIIKKINADFGLGLQRINIRVIPRHTPEPLSRTPLPPLPDSAAYSLEATADMLSDEDLSASLRRLASRRG